MSVTSLERNRTLSPAVQDRRVAARHRTRAEAWADPGGMEAAISCTLLDISGGGAKLACDPGVVVPERFVLHAGHAKRAARVVWRRGDQFGVAFDGLASDCRES